MSNAAPNSSSSQAFVVSDCRRTWKTVRDALRGEDYDPRACDSADAAVDRLAVADPAVVVVDHDVVAGDCLPLCESIRALPSCEFIPLILLAADASDEYSQQAYDHGVTTVLKKPLDEAAFRSFVASLGDTGKTISGVRALRSPEADVLRGMPDAFFMVGKDGLLRQYLGGANDDPLLTPESIEGQLIGDIWPAETAQEVLKNIRRVFKTRDGHAFDIELACQKRTANYEIRLLVQGRDRVLMIIRNITGSAVSQPDAERGTEDTLTGLTAREVFREHFDSIIADAKLRERGIAVFCIDIDRFTRINETLGRAVGDAVLKVTAKRIERCLRSSDQLARIDDPDSSSLTRISGDEFVLVLADIESREDVGTVASRVQEAFEEPVSIEGHQLKITPSIGIALYPLDGDNADDLLRNARVALDEAKVLSADRREFYSSTMKFRAVERFDVKNELRWAIEKEQLELYYLPRIDLTTGYVAGLEALLRWIHPLRGSVPLAEVIPLAEATGLIFPIGEWVVASACEQAKAWIDDNPDAPPVSINLSQQEFSRTDLTDIVDAAIAASGLDPANLELEVTEGMLMRNRQADAVINGLSGLGVGIVLDDFGQGHSSIAHLTTLPIKAIKIDRSFINGVREPGEKQAICSAMIAMSRELGISVIAEGVESEIQVEFLKERGCDAVQGFLYTEPLPADKVPAFLVACKEVADESVVIDLHTVRKKIAVKTGS